MAKKPKLKLKPFQLYTLIEQDVIDGLGAGWHRARKYVSRPRRDRVWEAQREAIMSLLDERFDLE